MEKLTHDLKQSELRRGDEARLASVTLYGMKVSRTWQQTRDYSTLHGKLWVTKQSLFPNSLFDKSSPANWLVVCHQDTALPIQKRHDALGWGPWSVKDGVTDAHAPASALSQVSALRVHLDESNVDAGPEGLAGHTHERRFN